MPLDEFGKKLSENSRSAKQDCPGGELFIFRTNIAAKSSFTSVKEELLNIPGVAGCTIDLDDCDRVLRVECRGVNIECLARQVRSLGFECDELEE